MTDNEFLSRNEKLLRKYLGEDIDTEEPQSPIEELLKRIIDKGGGEVTDYNSLKNKPKINGVELSGDINPADMNIQPKASITGEKLIFG